MSTRLRAEVTPRTEACRWMSAASEYGSSPDEQPALQIRRRGAGHAQISGMTREAIASKTPRLRKSRVTLMVSASSNRSYSIESRSRTRA
jgi:hypothetical protein